MGIDEAGTLARLKAMRRDFFDPLITAHSGRTFKLMGDGALVEFASAVDAVTCAIEVQKQVQEHNTGSPKQSIQFRIGINVGDIIVEGDDIYGDGVNVAARIQALADPGGIYISRGAAEQVRDKVPIKIETRGEQTVKIITRPIEVFCIIAEDRDATGMRLDPLYRDIALYFLAEARISLGQFDEAVAALKLPLQRNSNSGSYALLASCYGHLGRITEAQAVWAEVMKIAPDFSIERRRRILRFQILIISSTVSRACARRVFPYSAMPEDLSWGRLGPLT